MGIIVSTGSAGGFVLKQADSHLNLCCGILEHVDNESEQTEVLPRSFIHNILTMTDEGIICFNFHVVN